MRTLKVSLTVPLALTAVLPPEFRQLPSLFQFAGSVVSRKFKNDTRITAVIVLYAHNDNCDADDSCAAEYSAIP